MTNEEYFEQMFPSLVNADAFTIGNRRFVSMDKMLEIIDKAQTYKMAVGSTDLYIDREEFRNEVLALKGEQG